MNARAGAWLVGVAAVLSACAPAREPQPPPTPTAVASVSAPPRASASPAPDASSPPAIVGGYVRAWEAKVGGWGNRALAVTASGDVLALGSREVILLAHADGKIVRRLDISVSTPSALDGDSVFLSSSADIAAVVLQDGIYEMRIADFALRKAMDFPANPSEAYEDTPHLCARGKTRLVVANNNGVVVEYDLGSYKQVATRDLGKGKKIEALAYDADDRRLAVCWDDGPVTLLEGATPKAVAGFKGSSGALAFAPDGKQLFGVVDAFRAGEVALADGFVRGNIHISSWLTRARYLDDAHVVATGADGLSLFTIDPPNRVVLDEDSGEALGLSSDGSFLCAGGRSDHIACYQRAPR